MWQNLREKMAVAFGTEGENDFEPKPAPVEPVTKLKIPQSVPEFIEVLRETPQSVLDGTARARIAAVMSFDERKVRDVMVPKSDMVFVNEKDLLGPLMLDKLYKSGFTNFPVVNNYNRVCGVIHTEALNMLEVKKTERASAYMSSDVEYLRDSDSLMKAVEEIGRTNAYYFLVLDEKSELAGFFTVQMLLDFFLGK